MTCARVSPAITLSGTPMPLPESYIELAKLPTSISLAGVKEKLAHALVLRQRVRELVREYDAAMTNNLEISINAQGWHVFRLRRTVAIPDGISVHFGDYLNNARSALDYLAFQLVLVSGNTPTERTSFPIARTEQQWKSMVGDVLRAMDPAFVPVLEKFQPFRAVNPETHPLVLLNSLNNENKHRLLPVARVAYRELYYHIDLGQAHQFQYTMDARPSPKMPVNAGDVVTALKFTPPLPAGSQCTVGPGTLPTLGFDTPTTERLGIKELPDFVGVVRRIGQAVEGPFDDMRAKLLKAQGLTKLVQGSINELRITTHI